MSVEIYILSALIVLMIIREYRAKGIDGALDFLIDTLQRKGHDVRNLAQNSSNSKTQKILIEKSKQIEKEKQDGSGISK